MFKKICILVFVAILPVISYAQCSVCNATNSTSKEAVQESALAMNNGILFLMTVPYIMLILMVVIYFIYRRKKKNIQI